MIWMTIAMEKSWSDIVQRLACFRFKVVHVMHRNLENPMQKTGWVSGETQALEPCLCGVPTFWEPSTGYPSLTYGICSYANDSQWQQLIWFEFLETGTLKFTLYRSWLMFLKNSQLILMVVYSGNWVCEFCSKAQGCGPICFAHSSLYCKSKEICGEPDQE